jgi:hypothetical protein
LDYAKICRVAMVMRPYLEATVWRPPKTCPRLCASASSTAQNVTGDHSTNCSNTMQWSGFFTGSLNPLTFNDLFSKAPWCW